MRLVTLGEYPRLHVVHDNDEREEKYPRNSLAPCVGLVGGVARFRFTHYRGEVWVCVDLSNPKNILSDDFKVCCEWAWQILNREVVVAELTGLDPQPPSDDTSGESPPVQESSDEAAAQVP